jgi:biopolymer transport protein ExbD
MEYATGAERWGRYCGPAPGTLQTAPNWHHRQQPRHPDERQPSWDGSMGMKLVTPSGNTEPDVLMEVNTTPLIDVMLVLLVMLIITIPMQLHSLELFIGKGTTEVARPKPVVHVVTIDFDGRVYWDNQALDSREALDAKMRQVGALAAASQPEVHLKPNKLVDYGAVAAVMASAQNHGVKKMGMAGNEQFAG